jgi:ubiquinone/menaquinone biosynthesis C-methylase UbiE
MFCRQHFFTIEFMKYLFLLLLSMMHACSFSQNTGGKKQLQDSLSVLMQKKVIDFLHISLNDSIADIGTGSGAHLIAIANEYPSLHFTAEDIDSNFCNKQLLLKTLIKTGNKTSIENFTIHYGTTTATLLPAAGFSKVLAFDVLHEMTWKPAMLADIKRILKANGVLYLQEILVHKKIKKDRVCNYPYLTESELKVILADNKYAITRQEIAFDTGDNKYIKLFECVPVN